MNTPLEQWLTRTAFLALTGTGIGTAALATVFGQDLAAQAPGAVPAAAGGLPGLPHFAPRAKRVIYLFQSGAPSQHELWDYKPKRVAEMVGEDLPPSVRGNQRVTTMTAAQERFPLVPSKFPFRQHGESRTWVSDLMPHTAGIVDELCFVKSMHTEAINHDPGITFFQTGAQLAGRPSIGAWLSYGLGTMNTDLPTFVAMISKGSAQTGQPLYDRLWGSGFLPTRYQGVKFLSTGDPVLYLSNPPGVDQGTRRRFLDDLGALNRLKEEEFGDPGDEHPDRPVRDGLPHARARCPSSPTCPTSRTASSSSTARMPRQPGTFARNCLLARRLAERGVRFIQCFHRGWDQHTRLPTGIERQARDVDQPQAALVQDLKNRGLLDETLVVWGGEFGRSAYCQGVFTEETYGRDHHPRCFTIWMAGGGVKPGTTYGASDDFSYNIAQDPGATSTTCTRRCCTCSASTTRG